RARNGWNDNQLVASVPLLVLRANQPAVRELAIELNIPSARARGPQGTGECIRVHNRRAEHRIGAIERLDGARLEQWEGEGCGHELVRKQPNGAAETRPAVRCFDGPPETRRDGRCLSRGRAVVADSRVDREPRGCGPCVLRVDADL